MQAQQKTTTKAPKNTYNAPHQGLWPSRDPIGEDGGVNLYAFVGNDPLRRFDILGLATILTDGITGVQEIPVKTIALIFGPNYVSEARARGGRAKSLGVAEGTFIYKGKHKMGLSVASYNRSLKLRVKEWEKKKGKICCVRFKVEKIGSTERNPMTAKRASKLVAKWSSEADLTVLIAHGIRKAPNAGGETGLVFHIGKDSNGWGWGVAYSAAQIVPNEMTELPILACYDAGIPATVNEAKIIKVGGNEDNPNIVGELGAFFQKYVNKQCDACDK